MSARRDLQGFILAALDNEQREATEYVFGGGAIVLEDVARRVGAVEALKRAKEIVVREFDADSKRE